MNVVTPSFPLKYCLPCFNSFFQSTSNHSFELEEFNSFVEHINEVTQQHSTMLSPDVSVAVSGALWDEVMNDGNMTDQQKNDKVHKYMNMVVKSVKAESDYAEC